MKDLFNKRKAVLATMHKKEEVIAPILKTELGIEIIVPLNFNSDKFGTFTNEIERAGNQLEAARKKVEQAMKDLQVTLGVASEGSFGPHPAFPYVSFNRELILLIDQEQGLEVTGYVANGNTNYAQKEVKSFEEAHEFALSIGFPSHGVIVGHDRDFIKGITDVNELKKAVRTKLDGSATTIIETDMRAMYNPTRMKNIELATYDLVKKIKTPCPSCQTPGFEIKEAKKGLVCMSCNFPTDLIKSYLYECKKCSFQEEVHNPNGKQYADPMYCQLCNP
ncbi:hypothetical protein JCM9140_3517 [Halalkalibacter wakoensis JCM 9140]|uniref:DUF6671 domain-containing protein n=1 Tax=Halalkalibacter wakoensis JCM 9140 TaxID=1236970 RepID=W4Q5M6_9BACI|nr:DUF6671 family protein [Halalkalibacter wakoensis]GAE27381.1 hypothetical protein JCM9140_3517 [Halalkalibacter wakoensis JCM 9140]